MSKPDENYIEYDLKIENEADLNKDFNLVGIQPTFMVGVQMKLFPLKDALFKGINDKRKNKRLIFNIL